MKVEKKMVIGLASILFTVLLILFIQNYVSYVNLRKVTKSPFSIIEVLGQKIRLKDSERTYNVDIKCDSLTDANTQILYYRLNEKYNDYKITVSNKVFNNQNVVTDDYKNITEIDTNISIIDPKNKYEQVYHIKATCQIDEEKIRQEEEAKKEEEKKTQEQNQEKNGSNKSTKKTTKN